jgi:hypothetical protein
MLVEPLNVSTITNNGSIVDEKLNKFSVITIFRVFLIVFLKLLRLQMPFLFELEIFSIALPQPSYMLWVFNFLWGTLIALGLGL